MARYTSPDSALLPKLLADVILMIPLPVEVLPSPDTIVIIPPVPSWAPPPDNIISPPLPLLLYPTATETLPARNLASPVLIITLPAVPSAASPVKAYTFPEYVPVLLYNECTSTLPVLAILELPDTISMLPPI